MWEEVKRKGRKGPPGTAGVEDRRRLNNSLRCPTREQRLTFPFIPQNLAPRPRKVIVCGAW